MPPTALRISQVIVSKIGATAQLMSFVQRHATALSEPLGERLSRFGELDSPQQVIRQLLMAKMALLEEATRQMRDAERAYLEEQDDDITLRGDLAEASIELNDKLRLTRDHIRRAEGDNALQIYGLSDAPPRAREALVAYAYNAIELLSSHPYSFRGNLGQVLETRAVAVVLNDLLEPFSELVDTMSREIDELRGALLARNEAIDTWLGTYQGIMLWLQAISQLTEQHELLEELDTLVVYPSASHGEL